MFVKRETLQNDRLAMLRVAMIAFAAATAGFLSSETHAADLNGGPQDGASGYDWSGLYVGGVVGYSRGGDTLTEYTTATGAPRNMAFDYDLSGFSGGAKIGANMQSGSFVYGAEADLEVTSIEGTFIDSIEHLGRGDDSYAWQGSLRARAGFAMERMMIYGTAGVAAARAKNVYTLVPFAISEPIEDTRYGWTAGAGIDYALTDNVIAGIEFRHTRLNEFTNVSTVAFPGISGTQEPALNSLKVSLSYKF